MKLISQFMFWLSAMNAALLTATAAVGIWLWAQGTVSAGVVATRAAARLADRQRRRLGELGGDRHFREHRRGAGRHANHCRPAQRVDRPGAKKLEVSRGEIRFDDVLFTYGRRDAKPVLDHLNFTIRPGERVGLVGRSGAGKSTLVNLLLRFYELEQGAIRIDGQDIANVTQESLRAAIGMVTQDTSLLHRSIADNIRYGRPGATDGEVRAAARKAQAHEFILGLQDWKGRTAYDAHVGRTRRQALRRAAPACGACKGGAERRADPRARRSHFGPRQRKWSLRSRSSSSA